jgi:hypothetical protein
MACRISDCSPPDDGPSLETLHEPCVGSTLPSAPVAAQQHLQPHTATSGGAGHGGRDELELLELDELELLELDELELLELDEDEELELDELELMELELLELDDDELELLDEESPDEELELSAIRDCLRSRIASRS